MAVMLLSVHLGWAITLLLTLLAGAVVSLNPSTFVDSGLLDDADVQVTDIQFCIWNYGGKYPDSLALGVEFTELYPQQDGTFKKHEQYYSAGDLQYFRPSADGSTLEPVGDKTAMNSNTNAAQFLGSVVKAGFPAAQFEAGSCKVLKLLKVHVNRVAQPKRAGLTPKAGDSDKEKTVLLVSRILAPNTGGTVPGTTQPGSPAPSGSPFGGGTQFTPPPVAAVPTTPPNTGLGLSSAVGVGSPSTSAAVPFPAEVIAKAQITLINLLASAGGKLGKMQLPAGAFKALVGDPLQQQVVPCIFDERFLTTCQGITYDGVNVTLA